MWDSKMGLAPVGFLTSELWRYIRQTSFEIVQFSLTKALLSQLMNPEPKIFAKIKMFV